MPVVRVTVSLDRDLVEELKRLSKKEGVSLSKFVARSLEEFLIERKKKKAGRKLLEVRLSEEEGRLAMEELSRMRRKEWRG